MLENKNLTPAADAVIADETLIYGQFDSEPTWLARQNIAADALRACVTTADFDPQEPNGLSYSA